MKKAKKDFLVLIDKNDNILGYEEKIKCHQGAGIKHRAFSIFLFDQKGYLLIQKRAKEKMLWPGFWANTCCSHSRRDEDYLEAGKRRLKEELGIEAELKLLFKFSYEAQYKNIGSENELCAVLVGKYQGGKIKPDLKEIEKWQWLDFETLKKDIKNNPQKYAPWFLIEMEKLSHHTVTK